jgi:hypothetical protein
VNQTNLDIELRGYEVCRIDRGRAIRVSNWSPTDYALDEAVKSAAWLNDRHPNDTYVVRAVISIPPPRREPEPAPTQLELPFMGHKSDVTIYDEATSIPPELVAAMLEEDA